MMHGKFAQAKDDLIRQEKTTLMPKLTGVARRLLASAERFYIPGSEQGLLEGSSIDDHRDALHLPYDCIAILSPTRIRLPASKQEADVKGLKITLAANVFGVTNKAWKLLDTTSFCEADRPILVMSLTSFKHSVQGLWMPFPAVAAVDYPSDGRGMRVGLVDTGEGLDQLFSSRAGLPLAQARRILMEDLAEDIAMTHLLCVMLSLRNVREKQVAPDEKLVRSRRIRGKSPLPPYRVLDVNGDVWASPDDASSGGDGYRSHLRRGHIRRLDESRRVWVSSCFVRGRKEGFADKDYRVVSPTSSPASPHEGACSV